MSRVGSGRRAATPEWTLRRRVGASFTAFAVVFAVLVVAIATSLALFIERGDVVVNRWAPAQLTTERLLDDMLNQETGFRGYALTGSPSYLQPFRVYSRRQRRDQAALDSYVSGSAALRSDARGFASAAQAWRVSFALPAIALVRGHGVGAVPANDTARGKQLFDRLRVVAVALSDGVSRRADDASSGRRAAITVTWITLGLSALIVAGATWWAWRGLHRLVLSPVDRLALQTREVARGSGTTAIQPSGPRELRGLGADVETMRRRIVGELQRIERAGAELERSNADLEQFAYVASHDLSEPLRKVANFCQLLERQYGPQLDDRARQYIAFAVDGAKRMQALIADLLTLSRVGRTTESFVPVDTAVALAAAMANLESIVAETGGGVGHSDLPTVLGDESLLTSLFENLIGNAIKYRSDQPPLIVVTAVRNPNGEWTFAVKDNGIGVEPQYSERIFAIFQRLHLRDAYPGTGVGLALCRKIVEFHGGRIWLDTAVRSGGATFRFTLPERPPP